MGTLRRRLGGAVLISTRIDGRKYTKFRSSAAASFLHCGPVLGQCGLSTHTFRLGADADTYGAHTRRLLGAFPIWGGTP